ncbi:hypothetical protein [Phenylobacterium sp.]|uniref:hypothetical protein n=1 Tax=Phenylobacterium sp. TaxID=1871053 RepID=UPI0037839FD4
MTAGYRREAELSRAALVVAAGGALIGVSQRVPGLAFGLWGTVLLVAGGAVIAFGLILAGRCLFARRGGADQ